MSGVTEDELELRPNERETVDSFERQRVWIVWGAAALALVGFLAALLGTWLFGTGDMSSPNELGDYVAGTAGPLWALAGVLLVYLAFVGQRVQIVYQQAELRATRAEFTQQTAALEGQQAEMERQVLESRRQTFDNAFFQMLRLYNDILAETGVPGLRPNSTEMVRGRDAFDELVAYHRRLYDDALREEATAMLAAEGITAPESSESSIPYMRQLEDFMGHMVRKAEALHDRRSPGERRAGAIAAYDALYRHHQHEVGHYFRTLYHVVRFVDRAEPTVVPDKQRYVSIVRSQLSSPELVLLSYNGLTQGREKFKPLMERYGLLKQMPGDDLVDTLRSEYAPGAFGRGTGSSPARGDGT